MSQAVLSESALCPCGSKKTLANCCGLYLSGSAIAPTAEALMRSRYTAFHQGHIDYLIATHKTPDSQVSLAQSIKRTRWLNLRIVNTKKGKAKDKTGIVEFVAAYQPAGSILSAQPVGEVMQMHERSHFIKSSGKSGDRWLYTTGEMLPPYQPKRTEPCWCGSHKKFKHCHG